ncbi:13473_t:CDS:1, partial [Dentiscutata erythropus]
KNPFLEFKNRIIEILNDFEINECFDSKIITNDRDKDILISEDDFELLITCKYRESKNIRFDDVERTAANSRFLNVQGVIVTNLGYGQKAIKVAKKYNIILAHDFNIKDKLRSYIDKMVERKELDILEDIEREEKISLYF